jgi:FKBP-type peptidyl-prolyl cis-trans isomerase SlyD
MSDQVITDGKYVSLTYTICDAGGQVLEQSDLPVGYVHGGHQELIGDMDRAVAGKRAGETVEFALAPEEAFGPHDPDLTFTDDIENVPPQFRHVGAEVQMQNESGDVKIFYVTRIESGRLTVDGNHPLAGKSLRVKVRIQEVREPTREELIMDVTGQSMLGGRLH